MPRLSSKVTNHIPKKKGECTTATVTFDAIQDCLNTLFDVRCSTKKTWGYKWYDDARYGCYNEARRELYSKPACIAKTVALKCIDELEMLRNEMDNLKERGNK